MIKAKSPQHFAFLTKYAIHDKHYDAREHIMDRINSPTNRIGLNHRYAAHPHFGDEHRDALMQRFSKEDGDFDIPENAFPNGIKPEHQKILEDHINGTTITQSPHLLKHVSNGKAMELFDKYGILHKMTIIDQRPDVARHVLDTSDRGTVYQRAIRSPHATREDLEKATKSGDSMVVKTARDRLSNMEKES